VQIYWTLLLCGVAAYWPHRRTSKFIVFFGVSTAAGILLAFHPLLPKMQSNSSAYGWGFAALVPIILMALFQIIIYSPSGSQRSQTSLTYLPVVVAASAVWLITSLGAKWEYHRTGHPM